MSDTKTTERADSEKTLSDELREAAAKLRETVKDAPPGPWGVNGPWWWDVSRHEQDVTSCIVTDPGNEPVAVLAPPYNRHSGAEKAAPWIALASPALAEPLASWLEKAAAWYDETTGIQEPDGQVWHTACWQFVGVGQGCTCFTNPLAVARVLNGTSS